MHIPAWLVTVSTLSIGIGIASALYIMFDIITVHRQKMWIMNIVWPVTALYGGLAAVWAYRQIGLQSVRMDAEPHHGHPTKPFWQTAVLATTHCGSGCTIGDLTAELGLASLMPALLGSRLLGTWTLDFVLAFFFGIVFQYFTIAPMRHLHFREGLVAALKADTLSLTAWQAGMYGWMALAMFGILGQQLPSSSAVFWFMMQIAMLFGFATSYPVNRWLLHRKIKEAM